MDYIKIRCHSALQTRQHNTDTYILNCIYSTHITGKGNSKFAPVNAMKEFLTFDTSNRQDLASCPPTLPGEQNPETH